jgi:hypothetical protein
MLFYQPGIIKYLVALRCCESSPSKLQFFSAAVTPLPTTRLKILMLHAYPSCASFISTICLFLRNSMMFIDPFKPPIAGPRFFISERPTSLQLENPKAYHVQSASRLLQDCPAVLPSTSCFYGDVYRGSFAAPTAMFSPQPTGQYVPSIFPP